MATGTDWKRPIILITIILGACLWSSHAVAGIGVQPTITELRVAPGGAKTGSFRVANSSEEPAAVKVEIEDWLKFRTGESPIDVEAWLFMDETEFELEPNEVRSIGYQIIAPPDIEGELIAMVFFSSQVPGGGTVSITGRFGVALYAGIEGTEVIDADVADLNVSGSSLGVVIENKGNVHLRPYGRVIIRDLEGNFVHEGKIPYSAVIFAGKKHAYPMNLDMEGFSSGNYEVEAIFDTGTIYEKSKTFKKTISIYIE